MHNSLSRQFIFSVILIQLLLISQPTLACTLWAAVGDRVQDNGVLIAKNRDWEPNQLQELRLIEPAQGYHYFGLYATGGTAPGLKAGINEPGLVVASASVGSLPRQARLAMPHTKAIMTKLLTECSSVDTALTETKWFVGPLFLILADHHKIAFIEIGPEGKTAVQVQNQGNLVHTNHYLTDKLKIYNQVIGTSSHVRLNRITELLANHAALLTIDDFIDFSNDRTNGPDNSLWRIGSKPKSTRTLASWIISIPPVGSPLLYIKLANPGQKEQLFSLNVNAVFKDRTYLFKEKSILEQLE